MRKALATPFFNNNNEQEVEFKINLYLHPAQEAIVASKARFKIVAAGRRFGKTMLAAILVIIKGLSEPDQNIWWVAPSHQQARIALRVLLKYLPAEYRDLNKTLGEITLPNGSRISIKSGDRYDNLRGEGLDLVVIDEAAFIDEQAWTKAIRPALSDRLGNAILISTYDGENWFYQLHRFVRENPNDQWETWEFKTADNPYIDPAEIEEAKRSLPHDVFMQEFMCVPLVFVGAVFSGEHLADAINRGELFGSHSNNRYCEAGLDWGWNFTALEICVETADGDVVWLTEQIFRNVELNERCEIIAEMCKLYNVQTIYCDAAGATENETLGRIFARLNAPTYVQPVPFNQYKEIGITTRRFFLQQGKEVLTNGVSGLIRDSKMYAYDESGKPKKSNDHTVDAATAFYASRSWVLGDTFSNEQE